MKFTVLLVTGLCLLGAKTASAADATPTEPKPQTTMAPPVEWVDPDTGRLLDEGNVDQPLSRSARWDRCA